MGLFLYTILFPGKDEERCRAVFQRDHENPDQNIQPENCHWHSFPKGPAVLLNDGAVGFGSAERLSARLRGPALLTYIYDDDYWGYELWEKGTLLDQFASLPGYFDADNPPNRPGDAETLARLFGVDPERIRRYLIPWPELEPDAFAYDGDQAAVGDSWQMADLLGALGFDYDLLSPPKPEKEPNGPAPARAELPETLPPYSPPRKGRTVTDTPVLPSALTNREYALQRAEALGEGYEDILLLLQSGRYQDLISRLAETIQAAPEEAGLFLLRAFCWKMLEGLSTRSRTPDMIRDLTRALELEPDNVMALRGRSSLTTTSRRYPQQIQDLTRLTELDPENRDLHLVARAYFHHWLKEDGEARADLEAVLARGELWTVDLVYLCRELKLPGF